MLLLTPNTSSRQNQYNSNMLILLIKLKIPYTQDKFAYCVSLIIKFFSSCALRLIREHERKLTQETSNRFIVSPDIISFNRFNSIHHNVRKKPYINTFTLGKSMNKSPCIRWRYYEARQACSSYITVRSFYWGAQVFTYEYQIFTISTNKKIEITEQTEPNYSRTWLSTI